VNSFLPRRRKAAGDPLEVGPGERVLAQARTPSGALVGVTARALYLPQRTGETRRIAWDDVVSAGWDSPVLEVLETGASVPARVNLEEPGRVPEAVRERVTASIVVSERVVLALMAEDEVAGAQITGRRVPDSTDLHWTVTFDRGLDPTDPALRAAADAELARIRDWYGP
jgi:hypothetical protein